jgi:hypothetical protein
MNARNTWLWFLVAAGLFAFIFFFHRPKEAVPTGPQLVLPNFHAAEVTGVQVRPYVGTTTNTSKGQLEIRADRTNGTWRLTQPLNCPAMAAGVDNLLTALERLTSATYLTGHDRMGNPKADEEAGLAPPRMTVLVQPGNYQIWVGALTPPGDQVFLQVIGIDGVYVVDADLLKRIPQTANDWRDRTLFDLKGLAFNRIAMTNGAKIFELQRDAPGGFWRRTYPSQARANNQLIAEALRALQTIRIEQFVSDDPKADLTAFGLQPAELELALAQGTNAVALLQFGKNPTNAPGLIYARRWGQDSVVTVANDAPSVWRSSLNDFRDPHLLSRADHVDVIEVQGEDSFSLQLQTNGTWRVLPQDWQADPETVSGLLSALCGLTVADFVKDVVTEPDWQPIYGLASPVRQYLLKTITNNAGGTVAFATNVWLKFGTNKEDRIYVRRGDESSVYAVKLVDYKALPSAGLQFRDHQIWSISTNDVAGLNIRQGSKVRELLRNGPHNWSLAPGSSGVINDVAVEETVRGLCRLSAGSWVARGDQNLARYGLGNQRLQITLELKNGQKAAVKFGEPPYAAVTLDGEVWVFEFPWLLRRDVEAYLTIPPNTP